MPEVGVKRQAALRFLRRAGHVDRRGDELVLLVPEEQHVEVVVLVAFDAAELLVLVAPYILAVPSAYIARRFCATTAWPCPQPTLPARRFCQLSTIASADLARS